MEKKLRQSLKTFRHWRLRPKWVWSFQSQNRKEISKMMEKYEKFFRRQRRHLERFRVARIWKYFRNERWRKFLTTNVESVGKILNELFEHLRSTPRRHLPSNWPSPNLILCVSKRDPWPMTPGQVAIFGTTTTDLFWTLKFWLQSAADDQIDDVTRKSQKEKKKKKNKSFWEQKPLQFESIFQKRKYFFFLFNYLNPPFRF